MSFKHLGVVALFGLSVGNLASATIILDNSNADCSDKVTPTSQPAVEASFKTLCATGDVDQLYKSDFATGATLGTDSGLFKDSYNTTYGGFEGMLEDPSTALIEYILGQPAINYERVFLLAKDGNHDPSYYGWDITGWNGIEALSITAWKDTRGAISNVTIWGSGKVSVPEPGTLGLLGLGLVALGLVRRRIVR